MSGELLPEHSCRDCIYGGAGRDDLSTPIVCGDFFGIAEFGGRDMTEILAENPLFSCLDQMTWRDFIRILEEDQKLKMARLIEGKL